MKRRILVLFLAVLCMTALLSSCGDGDCVHTDADANNVCDNCQIPVVTIKEFVSAEEEVVETVVKPMPSNIKFSEFVDAQNVEVIAVGTVKPVDHLTTSSLWRAGLYVIRYTDTDDTDPENVKYTDIVKLYDAINDKYLYEFSSGEYTSENAGTKKTTLVAFENYYVYTTSEAVYNAETLVYDYTYNYYTFAGELIATYTGIKESVTEIFDNDYRDSVSYFEIADETFAIDTETYKVLEKADSDLFIKRPAFSYADGKYGYVLRNGKIYVYDLAKWINCVHSFDVPAGVTPFYLADGKVLFQVRRGVASDSANYDVLIGGVKYAIDYKIVDVAAKTETEVEFGYYIIEGNAIDEETVKPANAKNELYIQSIQNKEIATKTEKVFVDGELNIVANLSTNYPFMVEDITNVAPGYYVGKVVYGEGSDVNKVYDDNGNEICTLPSDADMVSGILYIDGKFYSWDMKTVKLDLIAEGYAIENEFSGYVILSKTVEATETEPAKTTYYYYSATVKAPVLINDADTKTIDDKESDYYVVCDTADAEKTVYVYYNANGEKLLESETKVTRIFQDYEGIWRIDYPDGSIAYIR